MSKELRLPINIVNDVMNGENFLAPNILRCQWSASGKRLTVQSKFGGFQRAVLESTKETVRTRLKEIVDAINNEEV